MKFFSTARAQKTSNQAHYPEIWLRIDQGSAPSVSVTGARNDKDKERIMSLLEEIWQDDSWLPAA
ncbi:DinI-like family protein [Escherichia coli]|uniref:DinI-like family protein n=1 Tax=Escherichia coli TaxID=562 RepID=UPI001F237092|nr:DinI-like family protein [Escherichia coli]